MASKMTSVVNEHFYVVSTHCLCQCTGSTGRFSLLQLSHFEIPNDDLKSVNKDIRAVYVLRFTYYLVQFLFDTKGCILI